MPFRTPTMISPHRQNNFDLIRLLAAAQVVAPMDQELAAAAQVVF